MIPEDDSAAHAPLAEAAGIAEGADPVEQERVAVVPEPPAAPSPTLADGVLHPLDSRRVTLQRVVGLVVAFLQSLGLLGGLAIVLVAAPLLAWVKVVLVVVWVLLTLALLRLAWRWPEIEHRHAAYKLDVEGLEIRRGVVWRHAVHVPRSRVQHTDVSQGPLERRFGLGKLVLYTAGTDHAKVEVHGLSHATALALRDHLLPGESGGDAV